VVVRGPAGARLKAARQLLARLAADEPGTRLVATPPSQEGPFIHPLAPTEALGDVAGLLWVPDLHEAFVNTQTNATRLVTTQPLYLLSLWTEFLQFRPGLRFLATVDVEVVRAHGPEALDGRGTWRQVSWVEVAGPGVGGPARGISRLLTGRAPDDGRAGARRRTHARVPAGDGERLHGSERSRQRRRSAGRGADGRS
jgi:hypothetical protein